MNFDVLKKGDRVRVRPGSDPHAAGRRLGAVHEVRGANNIIVRADGGDLFAARWDDIVVLADPGPEGIVNAALRRARGGKYR